MHLLAPNPDRNEPTDFLPCRATLIRLLVPLEPASGFASYEYRLAAAAKEKHRDEVQAYVAAGVAPEEAINVIREKSDLTPEERAHALSLLKASR